jgi:6-phosphogluconolactonase
MIGSLVVCADRAALNAKAAECVRDIAKKAIFGSGTCAIALSGGSTPKSLYALMAAPEWNAQYQWDHIHLFWGDERCVPIAHPDSNYAMVQRELLSKVAIPEKNIHRYPVELNEPNAVAAEYEKELKEFFGTNGMPRFDLVLLGLGENGHTASLFPHCAALQETKRLVVADWVEEVKTHRLTFTAPLINAARQIMFLVSGASKAQVLKDVLEGPRRPEDLPAQLIAPSSSGKLTWLADKDAASALSA